MENKEKNLNKRCINILFVNNHKIKKTKCFPKSFNFFYFSFVIWFRFTNGPLNIYWLTITTVDITKPKIYQTKQMHIVVIKN